MPGAREDRLTMVSGSPSVRHLRCDIARGTDVEGIFALRSQLVDWLASMQIDQWRHSDTTAERLAVQVAGGEWHVVRGTDENLAAAFRMLRSDPEFWGDDHTPAVYVHGLMVDRALTGQRLGSAVLAWAADHARAIGAEVFRLDCGESNSALREYYRSHGFHEVGRRDFDHGLYSVTLFERRLRT